MKKKLLTLLLSIAVVLTSTVTVFAADLGDNPTIAQVLATNTDFPTTSDKAWQNEKGILMFLSSNPSYGELSIDGGNLSFVTSLDLTKSNNNYVFERDSITMIFVMDDNNKLESIKIEKLLDSNEAYKGTYDPITIADILPEGFPTTEKTGWTNGTYSLFVNGENLVHVGNVSVAKSKVLTPSGSNYTCEVSVTEQNKLTYTFVMNNDELEKITINSNFSFSGDGDYCPRTIINEVSFKSNAFDFSTFTPGLVTAPSDVEYEIEIKGAALLNNGEKKYEYENGQWNVAPQLSEIDQAVVFVEVSTEGLVYFDETNPITVTVEKDGKSSVLTKLIGEGPINNDCFLLLDENSLRCCLIFDAPVIKEVNINYNEFDFLKFNMKAPTVPTDAKYHTDPTAIAICLLDEIGPIAYSEGDDVWYEDFAGSTPIDIKDIENDVVAGSIVFPVLADDGFIFRTNLPVKANGKSLNHGVFDDVRLGLQEGYTLDADNDGGLFCLMFKRYEITEGKDAVINVDNNKPVLFSSTATYNTFYKSDKGIIGKVLVDDELVDPSNYTHASGSIEVTLKASYLSTLSNGKHTLTIVSTDGNASTYFTITRNPKPNPGYVVPKTGVE